MLDSSCQHAIYIICRFIKFDQYKLYHNVTLVRNNDSFCILNFVPYEELGKIFIEEIKSFPSKHNFIHLVPLRMRLSTNPRFMSTIDC